VEPPLVVLVEGRIGGRYGVVQCGSRQCGPPAASLVRLSAFGAAAFTAIDGNQLALLAVELLFLPDRPAVVPVVTHDAARWRRFAFEGKDIAHGLAQTPGGESASHDHKACAAKSEHLHFTQTHGDMRLA